MNTFGERLKKLRINKNKLQKEVAIDLDISSTGYSSYENNSRMPGLKMLIKIADYFNVSLDYLTGRDNKLSVDNDKLISDLEKVKTYIDSIENYVRETK